MRVHAIFATILPAAAAFSVGGVAQCSLARRRGAVEHLRPALSACSACGVGGAALMVQPTSRLGCLLMQGGLEKDYGGGMQKDYSGKSGGGGTATLEDTDFSVNTILKQLESIQQGTPKNIVILGTRHCSFLHQQIIEVRARWPKARATASSCSCSCSSTCSTHLPYARLITLCGRAAVAPQLLSYALVLSDNHIYTSGATGTHAAAIRGALRAENPELLTVILPQTLKRQPREIRELIAQVEQLIELGHDQLPLDAASRICNSELLAKGDQVTTRGLNLWSGHALCYIVVAPCGRCFLLATARCFLLATARCSLRSRR